MPVPRVAASQVPEPTGRSSVHFGGGAGKPTVPVQRRQKELGRTRRVLIGCLETPEGSSPAESACEESTGTRQYQRGFCRRKESATQGSNGLERAREGLARRGSERLALPLSESSNCTRPDWADLMIAGGRKELLKELAKSLSGKVCLDPSPPPLLLPSLVVSSHSPLPFPSSYPNQVKSPASVRCFLPSTQIPSRTFFQFLPVPREAARVMAHVRR